MIADLIYDALSITGFVFLMMLIIEYVNVTTKGAWQQGLTERRWVQYLIVVVLGATPGCLGAFAVVAMFSHRVVTFGALVAAMIATSGDEAFVMFSLFPEKAFLLTVILMILGFAAGWLTDSLFANRAYLQVDRYCQLDIHEAAVCDSIAKEDIVRQWRELSLVRALTCGLLLAFVLGVVAGLIGPGAWDWKRIVLLALGLIGFFITAYAPDHFLRVHLWKHIVCKHIPSIFLWTLGALFIVYIIIADYLNLEETIRANTLPVLIIASVIGIIPESGPHRVFTMMYAQGLTPFVVLLASSIVQDGHGMLPLLAHSRKQFLLVKAINLGVGLVVGLIIYFLGIVI